MKIETIPCKDCLLVPACKYKAAVKCNPLYTWYNSVDDDEIRSEKANEILKILPKSFTLHTG